MFNRLARKPPHEAAAMPLPLVLRESLIAGFAAQACVVPPRPAELDVLLRDEAADAAAGDIAATLFVAEGRDGEAALLHDCALATRRKARSLAPLVRAPLHTVDVAGLLHRAGEACALRALARAEAGTRVRLDAPSRAELCAHYQGAFTEQLIRDWALPGPVAEVLRTWRQFRATMPFAAAVVYYAHLLASRELHPEFFAPGLLRSVGAELGIDPARLAEIG